MLRLFQHGQRQHNVRHLHSARLRLEELHSRLVLSASGFAGNDCQPDLDLSGLPTQVVVLGDTLTIDLLAAGATATDTDSTGTPTNDDLRFQLDPDVGADIPEGATISESGVLSWTPAANQLGDHAIMILLLDAGSPVLADAEQLIVTVTDMQELNQAPVVSAIADQSVTANQLMEVDITATDPDSGDTLTFELDTDNLPTTANIVQTSNVTAVVRWIPTEADSGGPFLFRVIVTDDGSPELADEEEFLVSVQFPPSVDLNGAAAGSDFATTFSEGDNPIAIVAPGLTVTDLDSAVLNRADIKIQNNPDGTDELLFVDISGTTIDPSYDAASGELTLLGFNNSPDEFQQVLRTLTYQNLAGEPTPGDRSIVVTISDDSLTSDAVTSTVSVVTVNDPPMIVPIDDQEGVVDSTLLVDVTASDAESGLLTFSLVNSPMNAEIIKTSSTTATIQWIPDAVGSFGIQVQVEDDGDPELFTTEDFTVTVVAATNAAPVIDLNGDGEGVNSIAATPFVEDGGAVSLVTNVLAVTDADSAELTAATVEIANLSDGDAEVLDVDVGDATGVVKRIGDTAGVLTLTGTASLATYEAILETLTYNNTSQNPNTSVRSVEVRINDGKDESAVATVTVPISAVNDAPVLDLKHDGSFGVRGPMPIAIAPQITVADADSPTLEGAAIVLVLDGRLDGSDERLHIDTNGTAIDIFLPTEGDDGTLALVGTDTVENYQRVLRTLEYSNTAAIQTPGTRLVDIQVTDGTEASGTVMSTVIVLPPSDGNDVLSEAESVDVNVGQPETLRNRQLESGGDVDFFSVNVLAGETLFAEAGATITPALRIFDENGVQVNDAAAVASTAFVAAVTDTTYFVGISADDNTTYDPQDAIGRNGTATGIYNLTLSLFESDSDDGTLYLAQPQTIRDGVPLFITDSIDPGSDVDFFSVAIKADEVLRVDVIMEPDATIFVRVFNVQGTDIGVDAGGGSSVTATLGSDGGMLYVGISGAELTDYDPFNTADRLGSSVTEYEIRLERIMPALAARLVDAVMVDEDTIAVL